MGVNNHLCSDEKQVQEKLSSFVHVLSAAQCFPETIPHHPKRQTNTEGFPQRGILEDTVLNKAGFFTLGLLRTFKIPMCLQPCKWGGVYGKHSISQTYLILKHPLQGAPHRT